jgi:hypothetical protein
MVRKMGTTTTRGAIGTHLLAGRGKTLFSARSAPLDIENMLPINNLGTIWLSLAAAE